MLKKLIDDSAFGQLAVFQAVKIIRYFGRNGFTMEDIEAIKAEMSALPPAHARNEPTPPPPQRKQPKVDYYKGALFCPLCGENLFREYVCSGCAEGRAGKKIRLTCVDYPNCNFREAI